MSRYYVYTELTNANEQAVLVGIQLGLAIKK